MLCLSLFIFSLFLSLMIYTIILKCYKVVLEFRYFVESSGQCFTFVQTSETLIVVQFEVLTIDYLRTTNIIGTLKRNREWTTFSQYKDLTSFVGNTRSHRMVSTITQPFFLTEFEQRLFYGQTVPNYNDN